MNLAFDLTDTPAAGDLERLAARLAAFNDADVGPSGRRALAIFVRDAEGGADGDLVAGLSGYTAWGWLYVQWLWMAEGLRGQGLAGRLLAAAEAEAVARGCHGALIDTFSPRAERAYRRQGYVPFGALPDFPVGRRRVFLAKALAPAPEAPRPEPEGGS